MRSGKIPLGFLIAAVLLASMIDSNRVEGGGLQTEAATISGEVVFIGTGGGTGGPIVVEVSDLPRFSPWPRYSITLSQSGPYEVEVGPGAYFLRAFVDANQNRRWDVGEPIGTYPTERALIIVPLAFKRGIDIFIPLKSIEEQKKRSLR
ncbi:MAG: hypothetical protein MPW17_01005 [Candidatus Manganitrophus sp.]|nr:hypothetical protein [Candidatus Manganitrophus sp.]WDT71474.1 MAG: hypothetical protein MPW17_01005 [Candidatus Manganitrophus sp.]